MKSRLTCTIVTGILLALVVSCILVVTLAVPVWRQDDNPVVLIQQGEVRGSWATDGDYSRFMGIPYAKVNTENPFGDALPGPTFEGIFEANDDGGICPQVEEFNNTVIGSLDCLHVNVYVPRTASVENPLPVLVWIYGGYFSIGFAGQFVHGPEYLVRHNVVLVTFNYRLGPYGFMCLDTPSVPGNAGLKDQRRALEWVKNNISAFGGDKSRITISGNSAGAMSVEFHILSPGSNGLFHQAILQSGSAIMQVTHVSRPSAPIELAKYLGFQAETIEEAIDMIKTLPTNDIIDATRAIGISFWPCVEQIFDGVENIVTDFSENVIASEQFESVPMIVGYNSDEQLMHLASIHQDHYFEYYQNVVRTQIGSSFAFGDEELSQRVQDIVQQYYFGTKPIDKDTVYSLIDFNSDAVFVNPIERSLKYHMAKSDKPIYQYVFAYSGEINFVKRRLNITEGGAAHADEIAYLFKQIFLPDENTPEDQLAIDRVTEMWTNFVKYGDPTPEVSEVVPVRWPKVTEEREYLWIDSNLKIDRKPFYNRMAFWDLLFEAYGKYYRIHR